MRRRTVSRWPAHRIVDCARVLHHRDEAVGQIDPPVAVRARRHGDTSAILVRARGSAPCDADHTRLRRRIGERVDVAQIIRIFGREERPIDYDTIDKDRRSRIEPFAAVMREPEASHVLVAREHRAAGHADLNLEIAKAVERIRAAARRDAAAVLRPRRRVLNIPVLAVGRRKPRRRAHGRRGHRRQENGTDKTPHDSPSSITAAQ